MFARLLEIIFPTREDEGIVRACSSEELLTLLDPELVPLGNGRSAAALLPLVDRRVRAAVHEAKYRGNERAFELLGSAPCEYLREMIPNIVLDDVLTTGATLSAAVAALMDAGAGNVLAVALAH